MLKVLKTKAALDKAGFLNDDPKEEPQENNKRTKDNLRTLSLSTVNKTENAGPLSVAQDKTAQKRGDPDYLNTSVQVKTISSSQGRGTCQGRMHLKQNGETGFQNKTGNGPQNEKNRMRNEYDET